MQKKDRERKAYASYRYYRIQEKNDSESTIPVKSQLQNFMSTHDAK